MRQHKGKDITFQACKVALETLKRLSLQKLKCGGESASLVFPKSFRMIQKNGCYWKRRCLMLPDLVYFRNRWLPSGILFHCVFKYINNYSMPLLMVSFYQGC